MRLFVGELVGESLLGALLTLPALLLSDLSCLTIVLPSTPGGLLSEASHGTTPAHIKNCCGT